MNIKLPTVSSMRGLLLAGVCAAVLPAQAGPAQGWLNWRGPHQNGTSHEKNLPSNVDPEHPLWRADYPGASTAVVSNGKVYIMTFLGEGPDLQEGVVCLDADTGKKLWEHRYSDFLSDIIYNRYATSSPTIDPETGNVYMQGTQGLLAGFTPDGKELWKISMMELYGRLTFPNGRTASPILDQDLVITHGITANWGANGPGRDRFYAFDKKNGELVWASTPGGQPKDSSYSYGVLGWLDGRRVLYSSTGDGSVVCVNARTGDPIWQIPLTKAGINASVLVYNDDRIIAIYGTPYEAGQLVALKIPHVHPSPGQGPVEVDRSKAEVWSKDISTSTSSPILVGDTIYVVAEKGDLFAVNADTGKVDWSLKLGIEQRNSCPLYADGKLYVPMLDDPASKTEGSGEAGTKGAFYIIEPGKSEGKIICHVALDGRCFGTPTAYNGRIYIQTTRHLYCFGKAGDNPGLPGPSKPEPWPNAGQVASLQIIPAEVLLSPGEKQSFRVRELDANGLTVRDVSPAQVKWAHFIPPTAKVRASMKADFNQAGELVAADAAVPSAGAFEGTLGQAKGHFRGRVLPGLPLHEDFEGFTLNETNASSGALFAYPPLPWIGARFKFDIEDTEGSKALTKTIDNRFFQRATVFLGHPDTRNYTIEADVMSDGNRRKMSDVGLIDQRYYIVLKGNEQKLEINSNLERLRVPAAHDPPNFRWVPKTWYHLKAQVESKPDGSGMVRAKAWKKSDPEPNSWVVEVPLHHVHQNGSPGLFGFSPQNMRVYIDNVKVTQN